jgi:hypothetical protein
MTSEIRWRIITLQIIMTVLFLVGAIIAFAAGNFTHDYVQTQLSQQKVSFPAKGDPALDPQKFPDLQQYAGQAVDNGAKAKAYANGFSGGGARGVRVRAVHRAAAGARQGRSGEARASPGDLSGRSSNHRSERRLEAVLLFRLGAC